MPIVIISFIGFLVLITLIGICASLIQHKKSAEDYLVASRQVPAWLAALSAVATNNSGFMFVGLIAFTYRVGLEAFWMMIGWITGDLLAWIFVHPRVRAQTETIHANTIPALIGSGRGIRNPQILVAFCGIFTFIFLGAYAAAQLKAGSTALETLFGWRQEVGIILGTVIVVLYCFSGGIRASIWTDAAQSAVMIVSMIILVAFAVYEIGGPPALLENLENQDPNLVDWTPKKASLGFVLFLLGMVSGGLGAIGQPHILVRFMAIDSVEHIARGRLIYFAWFIPFFLLAITVGLYARAIIPGLTELPITEGLSEAQATEFAMPVLAQQLLPKILIGLLLAGLFSATMSTADSQILVCSGSITQDVFPAWHQSYLASKMATLFVAALAMCIALFGSHAVFSLVLDSWAALAVTLGPLVVLRVYGQHYTTWQALTMMAGAMITLYLWDSWKLDDAVYKLLPGLVVPFAIYLLTRIVFRPSSGSPDADFSADLRTEQATEPPSSIGPANN